MITSLPVNGGGGSGGPVNRVGRGLTLHRSNSSLELPHSPDPTSRIPDTPLRREYGSHGSIDVVAQQVSVNDNLFAMLQELRPSDQRSGSDFLRRVQEAQIGTDTDEVCGPSGSSPKLKLKLNRLWGSKAQSRTTMEEPCSSPVLSADVEERHRRRAFAHYDCQSLTANLGYAAKLRGILLARRRNTATGASAASTVRSSTPDESPEDDSGNDLLESCPFFRNEIGGEGEREVGLTRCSNPSGVHRPPLAYGVSVLEPPVGETLWKYTCPLQKRPLPVEDVDEGAHYYRRYFLGREHQNWFGMDEQLGPVAISIRKEGTQYRTIIRTSELLTLRGSVPEEALGVRPSQSTRPPTRELLELVAPEVQVACLRLGTAAAEEAVARLDEQGLSNRYKVGVLYCKSGQRTEEEMYNNQHAGPAFLEFLDTIGQRIRLRGFEGYKAGLDTRSDSTGTYAVAAMHRGAEVTFHVSTMLPFTPNNRQQLLRKRHIGNDIVTIVFQEPGALPFSPRRIRSQFQHVFIVVKAINPCTENTQYSVAVSRSKEVPIFGPPIPAGATFAESKAFADFILAKVINAENAAHRSEKFATMATRTRQEYLKDLATNYVTTTVVDTGQKFSMLSFSNKKKPVVRPRLSCDASQRGAICWQVILEDSNQNTDCYLGISVDSIVLIEEHSRQIVFVTPCVGVLGWHAQTNSLRLYHHQGECITIHVRGDYGDRDELMEIVARLRAVTQGSPATELSLKRNSLGQLGFHVQPDGVVTQVESMGQAWQAGLRQGSRLVEICKVAVSTLSHDQMVDLLKTSAQVTITVIPPTNEGNPRRGCTLQNCQYLSANYEGDYENVTSPDNTPTQQTAMSHQRHYERSFSPPRSSNSSGYGTGSSSRSFNDPRFPLEGTMTSSSSGHSSADDRWYELLERDSECLHRQDGTPPPLPTRHSLQSKLTPIPKKEKESQYGIPKQLNYHGHDQKENNYMSPRAIHENMNYQSFVKMQKEKYENKQDGLYASHREMQKNENQHLHQKLCASNSINMNQNSNYGMGKPSGSNNYEYDGKNVQPRHHEEVRMREKRNITYQYPEEAHEKRGSKYEMEAAKHCENVSPLGNEEFARYEIPHEFKVGEKVTCLKTSISERPVPHKVSIEYRGGKSFASSLPPDVGISDGNPGEVAATIVSEDEHSNGSSNVSPKMRRTNEQRSGNLTPSSASSRNQSPRPKPGARNSHRNSANLTSSTLQEDLMKLINPDFIAHDTQLLNNNVSNQNTNGTANNINNINNNNTVEIQNKCRSRENLCGNSNSTLSVLPAISGPENGNAGSEVILTMARPATVISNSSAASAENKMTKEERLSPRVTKTPHAVIKTPSVLATKESKNHSESETNNWSQSDPNSRPVENRQDWNEDAANNMIPNSVSELQNHLSSLELQVARETRRRLSLEDEVRRLRDENRRLQDESHAAAQQLRHITEWFFQSFDHQ